MLGSVPHAWGRSHIWLSSFFLLLPWGAACALFGVSGCFTGAAVLRRVDSDHTCAGREVQEEFSGFCFLSSFFSCLLPFPR